MLSEICQVCFVLTHCALFDCCAVCMIAQYECQLDFIIMLLMCFTACCVTVRRMLWGVYRSFITSDWCVRIVLWGVYRSVITSDWCVRRVLWGVYHSFITREKSLYDWSQNQKPGCKKTNKQRNKQTCKQAYKQRDKMVKKRNAKKKKKKKTPKNHPKEHSNELMHNFRDSRCAFPAAVAATNARVPVHAFGRRLNFLALVCGIYLKLIVRRLLGLPLFPPPQSPCLHC